MNRKTLIGVFAHPDDEIIVSGLLLKAIKKNYNVHLISVTHGEAGQIRNLKYKKNKSDELADIRVSEYQEVCKRIGVTSSRVLNYKDNDSINWDAELLLGELVTVFNKLSADIIVSFPLNGGNGHPDHIKVAEACTKAYHEYDKKSHGKLLYVSMLSKDLLKKKFWFIPNKKLNALLSKFDVSDSDNDFSFSLSLAQRLIKQKLPLMHKTQFPDEKGRIFKLPKLLYNIFSSHETYSVVKGNKEEVIKEFSN